MAEQINFETAIVFASFNEAENLAILLSKLSSELPETVLVVIADDSGKDYRARLETVCTQALTDFQGEIQFNYSDVKAGRGAAIRRTFEHLRKKYTTLTNFIEADSDGSHRAEDILKVLNFNSNSDLIIGSRYIQGSEIIGWPLSRRVLSKFLNLTIPKLLSVNAKDLTNGLRRYSAQAVDVILNNEAKNSGFIYLSECAAIISKSNMQISEVPIRFENRVHGSSTVGRKELSDSLAGVIRLVFERS